MLPRCGALRCGGGAPALLLLRCVSASLDSTQVLPCGGGARGSCGRQLPPVALLHPRPRRQCPVRATLAHMALSQTRPPLHHLRKPWLSWRNEVLNSLGHVIAKEAERDLARGLAADLEHGNDIREFRFGGTEW